MYDVVWFTAEKSEQAIRLLTIPPESEWRQRRDKKHPFRMWQNVPGPRTDGGIRPESMQCVAVDHQGSARLQPGGIHKNGKLVIAEFCSEIVEVEPGIIGARIKPDTWERPEFVKTAAKCELSEQKAKEKHAKDLAAAIDDQENAVKQARRRFLVALASIGHINWRTTEQTLTDICMLKKMEDAYEREIALEDWMQHVCPNRISIPDANAPYDPLTFLADAAMQFARINHSERVKGAA